MTYRFIALIGDDDGGQRHRSAIARLGAIGMACRLSSPSLKLFVATETPTLNIAGRGLIIGHVFSQRGRPIQHQLPLVGPSATLYQGMLENYWGEYLAFQLDSEDVSRCTVLRDPSGGIPCYYALEGGSSFLTSDVSLATDLGLYEKQVDWSLIAHSLTFPYLRSPRTALRGVNELLPGCVLDHHATKVGVQGVWSPWRFTEAGARHTDPHNAAADVRNAVSTAVKAWAAVSDRIVMELSGGLDSSIIGVCLREASAETTYCTLLMPVAGSDERQYARLVTDASGHELHTLDVGFENARFDFASPSWAAIPAIGILQRAVNEVWEAAAIRYDATSFFSGGGGDSVFCYLRTASPAADAFRERGFAAGLAAVHDLASLHNCTFWKAGKLTLKKLMRKHTAPWKADTSFINPAKATQSVDPHPWLEAPPNALPGDREKVADLVGTQLFRDTTPRGDGRTVRYPLLSQPVMEACLRVPTWMWIDQGLNRAIARAAFADELPDGIRHRRSKGSHGGYMTAVYQRNRHAMREFLGDGRLRANDLLDWPTLEKYLDAPIASRNYSFTRIFDLCIAENWSRAQAAA